MQALKIVKNGRIFELKDIQTEEVSVVDRAANKRKFICVKREEGDMKTEVVEKEGKLVVEEGTEDATSTEETVTKLELSLSPEQKGDLSTKLQQAMERVLEVTNAVRTAKEGGEAGSNDELLAEVRGIKSLIDDVDKMLAPKAEAPEEYPEQSSEQSDEEKYPSSFSKDASEEEIRKAAKMHAELLREKMDTIKKIAGDIADNAESMELKDLQAKLTTMNNMGWNISDLAETVNLSKCDKEEEAPRLPAGLSSEDLEKIQSGNVEEIAKVGRKMSSHNLGRFKKSLGELETVMKTFLELYQALLPDKSEKKELTKRMLESLGITMDSDYYVDNVGSGTQPDPEAIGNMGDNAGAEGKVKEEMKSLQKRVQDQEAKIKEQDKLIESLGSTVDAPSSGKPEGGAVRKGDGEDGPVYWGFDMNDPNYLKNEGLE